MEVELEAEGLLPLRLPGVLDTLRSPNLIPGTPNTTLNSTIYP